MITSATEPRTHVRSSFLPLGGAGLALWGGREGTVVCAHLSTGCDRKVVPGRSYGVKYPRFGRKWDKRELMVTE